MLTESIGPGSTDYWWWWWSATESPGRLRRTVTALLFDDDDDDDYDGIAGTNIHESGQRFAKAQPDEGLNDKKTRLQDENEQCLILASEQNPTDKYTVYRAPLGRGNVMRILEQWIAAFQWRGLHSSLTRSMMRCDATLPGLFTPLGTSCQARSGPRGTDTDYTRIPSICGLATSEPSGTQSLAPPQDNKEQPDPRCPSCL